MYDPDGNKRGPQPVPVPADPPVAWGPGKKAYAERHWKFLKWQVENERADWPNIAVAPHEVSPEAWLRGEKQHAS